MRCNFYVVVKFINASNAGLADLDFPVKENMEGKHTVNNTKVDHSFTSVAILVSDICKVNSINLCFGASW